MNRILAAQFDAASDRRLKENIVDIKLEHAHRFLKEARPRRYNVKKEGSTRHYGYIAQEILSCTNHALDDLVSLHPNESIESSSPNIELADEPKGMQMSVSYLEIIPLLHRALQDAVDRIELLESRLQARAPNGRFTKTKRSIGSK
jgi:hypothetical protein